MEIEIMKKIVKYFKKAIVKIKARKKAADKFAEGRSKEVPEASKEAPEEK